MGFLREAFGFVEHASHPREGGRIEHAGMAFGNGGVTLGFAREAGAGWRAVGEAGGRPGTIDAIVEDVDSPCARAGALGP